MANSHVLISSQTLGSNTATVTFSSIPSTYRDLYMVITCTSTTGGSNGLLTFNGDAGANYARCYMLGNGSSTGSSAGSGNNIALADLETTIGSTIIHVMDYAATDKHKTVICRNDVASNFAFVTAGRWANTAAITSLTFATSAGNFAIGNTFVLYGVLG